MSPFSSPLMVGRRVYCSSALGPTGKKGLDNNVFSRKRLVFLGSPQVVAVNVLDKIMDASQAADSFFELAAIVTQPPSERLRGRKQLPSPVALHARNSGFPHDLIFTPDKAGEETFLTVLRALRPDLCITAAYGNILPRRFLEIPQYGTVNIHPSLLPLYRGAAPVQRALQDGVKETGVSLAYTVRALDAGPVIAKENLEVDDHIKAPELLSILFDRGSKLLLGNMPSILDGSAMEKAQKQDDEQATLAPKATTVVLGFPVGYGYCSSFSVQNRSVFSLFSLKTVLLLFSGAIFIRGSSSNNVTVFRCRFSFPAISDFSGVDYCLCRRTICSNVAVISGAPAAVFVGAVAV